MVNLNQLVINIEYFDGNGSDNEILGTGHEQC